MAILLFFGGFLSVVGSEPWLHHPDRKDLIWVARDRCCYDPVNLPKLKGFEAHERYYISYN